MMATPKYRHMKGKLMALLNFKRPVDPIAGAISPEVETFLQGYSIEVMPRTAEKVEDFTALLPKGTRVYVAHIEGTPIEDMVATAKRLASDGYPVMPHFPARIIKDAAMLENWIAMYQGEAGVDQAMGGGDIKMMAMVGSFLGLWGVALTIFLGSVVALVTILSRAIFAMAKSGTESDELERLIPFGVFLAAGGGVAWVWGAALVNWYLSSVIGL